MLSVFKRSERCRSLLNVDHHRSSLFIVAGPQSCEVALDQRSTGIPQVFLEIKVQELLISSGYLSLITPDNNILSLLKENKHANTHYIQVDISKTNIWWRWKHTYLYDNSIINISIICNSPEIKYEIVGSGSLFLVSDNRLSRTAPPDVNKLIKLPFVNKSLQTFSQFREWFSSIHNIYTQIHKPHKRLCIEISRLSVTNVRGNITDTLSRWVSRSKWHVPVCW